MHSLQNSVRFDLLDTTRDNWSLFARTSLLTSSQGSGHATTLRFSRKGDYLASGRVDGKVVIWYDSGPTQMSWLGLWRLAIRFLSPSATKADLAAGTWKLWESQ